MAPPPAAPPRAHSMSRILASGVLPVAIPFLVSTAGYFYLMCCTKANPQLKGGVHQLHNHLQAIPYLKDSAYLRDNIPNVEVTHAHLSATLKCLPILLLALLALRRGGGCPFSRAMLALGLVASSLGDYYLAMSDAAAGAAGSASGSGSVAGGAEDLFVKGMVAFGAAHVLYVVSFGFKPFGAMALVVAAAMGGSAANFLLPKLDGFLAQAVPVYMGVISIMLWRSLARLPRHDFAWPAICGAMGALSFVASDLLLAINRFYVPTPCKHAPMVIMATYYAGQLGIALSVMDRDFGAKKDAKKNN